MVCGDGGPMEDVTIATRDRAVGAMVGMAVGNALGSGYAFQPRPRPQDVDMRPGGLGPYEAGEWGDDTAMAIPLLQVLREGRDLQDPGTLDEVAARWVQWWNDTPDAAPVVAQVLGAYDPREGARSLREAATRLYAENPASGAGNASLMRTTPIALGLLRDPQALSRAARLYSDLTHGNPVAGDACVLYNLAQRQAILTADFDLAAGLPYLPDDRQQAWEQMVTQAEIGSPSDFAVHNGWASQLLQTAWSVVTSCRTPGPRHFEDALRLAVASGGDTPTLAAVTGGLLGARWGVSAIPLEWRRVLFGWPGYRDRELVWLVREAVEGVARPVTCHPDAGPARITMHPFDAGVRLGTAAGLQDLPPGVDAVVSLCPLGSGEVPGVQVAPRNQVDVWLVDSEDAADNPHLDHVVEQAVDTVLRLRGEGHTVYLHSARGRSRLPLVAALYGARLAALPASGVLEELRSVLPDVQPNAAFDEVLRRWD